MEGLFPEIANTNNRISTPAVLPRRSTHAHHKHRREVHKKEQTFLDFGQRLLEPKPCQQCGMTYQRGRKEDESLHTKFHRAWQRRQTKLLSWAAELQRALDILNVANEHLGAVRLELADLEQRQRKIFLYISPKGQVEGCILAEAIESAWRVVAARGTAPGPAGPENNHTTVEHAREPCPAICGINRIWVVPHARRCGVASQMIQAVCKQFVYGCIIDSSSIAFTQPTSDGRALAQRVFKRSDFLVYAED
ncbi:hypothetical protein GQ54DRAFT_262979 [Martensiomyces pterosporus]|nr:hypothetical protein GQ54DRAFT_262979 [Martensiomyces pterosporus]